MLELTTRMKCKVAVFPAGTSARDGLCEDGFLGEVGRKECIW